MMRKIIIFLALLALFVSIGAVSAEGNFTALQDEINSSTDSIEITQDYVYDNASDYAIISGIIINKSDFTINGNGYTIDASNQARIFSIFGNNITISNFNFINGNRTGKGGGAIYTSGSVTLNNVTFTNNYAKKGGAIYSEATLAINNATFTGNTATWGGDIYSGYKTDIFNSIFSNSTSKYAAAINAEGNITVRDSIFRDLSANETAGAIGIKKFNKVEINNCTFINTKAVKNAGAIFIDVYMTTGITYIVNSTFTNTTGDYGGALVQLGGKLHIECCEFANNTASFDGGAIYISCTNALINNTSIINNNVTWENFSCAGGLYIDGSHADIENCEFINNTLQGIYAYDSNLNITDSLFSNNGEAIHAVFGSYTSNNVDIINDTLFLNDTNYKSIFKEAGKSLILLNNTINVVTLPSRYDSREWGWTSSVKNQGSMGSCWTFGTCGALESALLKATGIEYDFSENNMQNSMLQYSKYGIIGAFEGGITGQGLEYILSWFGVMPTEYDTYDELGKLSPLISGDEKIHIFDAIFVNPRKNPTDNDEIKKAILMCGSVIADYYNNATAFNKNTSAYYQNIQIESNHEISLVGWDDNYPASNFNTAPPGDGAFILKNSWGTDFGENGYMYISYYDTSLLFTDIAIGFIIENTENYTTNYQTDLGGNLTLNNEKDIYFYKNTYETQGSDLISAIGSYFEENENYTIEIYVNDELVHTQSGIAPYYGFHTVKLTKEIPTIIGDTFTALMKKASIPLLSDSRQDYKENVTFADEGNGWEDLSKIHVTVSLKVYTKNLAIYTEDLVKIYKNDSKFGAYVGDVGVNVTFELNGIEYTRISDEYGIASIAINLNPGEYTIKTSYNGTAVENKITVLPTLIGDNLVKYFRNASQFFIDLIDGEGNPVTGVNITMNINGVFYNRLTNENGTAKLNINLNPGEYILTAIDRLTGLQMSYNITVLPILNATDLEMTYKDGSTFNVTVLDGQGKPLANASVSFNINGVFYTRYSDSNGIAKLNINLMAGKYIITSEYDNLRISNTITIRD